jgi:hypothetical protein
LRRAERSSALSSPMLARLSLEAVVGGVEWPAEDALDEEVVDGNVEGLGQLDDDVDGGGDAVVLAG